MGVEISDDVAQAVKALWMATPGLGTADGTGLTAGELKATLPSPEPDTYCQIKVDEGKDKEVFTPGHGQPINQAPYKDFKVVTLTIRGQYRNVARAAAIMRTTFGRNLLPTDTAAVLNQKTLAMPSGARFIKCIPQKQAPYEAEPMPKSGNEIWKDSLVIEVCTVRTEG